MINYRTFFDGRKKNNDVAFMRRIVRFLLGSWFVFVCILFFISVLFKAFHPFVLSLNENKKLFLYNAEVLMYEWNTQGKLYSSRHSSSKFYYLRYEIDSFKIFKNGENIELAYEEYSKHQNVEKRNLDRSRDVDVLKIGLKLYKEKYGFYPKYSGKTLIEFRSKIFSDLKEFIYYVPIDPDEWKNKLNQNEEIGYFYQSKNGQNYTIDVYFQSEDDLRYNLKVFEND